MVNNTDEANNNMKKFLKYCLIIFIITSVESFAKENFFNEAKNLFDKGRYEESKFLFPVVFTAISDKTTSTLVPK